jgi:hypothetical protein
MRWKFLQIIQKYREGGRVRQKVIPNMGWFDVHDVARK